MLLCCLSGSVASYRGDAEPWASRSLHAALRFSKRGAELLRRLGAHGGAWLCEAGASWGGAVTMHVAPT